MLPFSKEQNAPISAMLFRVTGITVTVKTLTFPGAAAVSDKELVAADPNLIGAEFSASEVDVASTSAFAPVYGRHGYLEARFDHPRATLIAGTSSDVAVAIPITEGPQFSWEKGDWTGNHVFSADELTTILGMKSGDLANLDKIDAGFAAVAKAYQGKGYIDAKVQPTQILDTASRRASFQIAVDEGPQYHMGQLRFQGFPDKLAAELSKKWNVKSGALYDVNYTSDFVKKVVFPKLVEARITGGRISMNLQRDAAKATVDVLISIQ